MDYASRVRLSAMQGSALIGGTYGDLMGEGYQKMPAPVVERKGLTQEQKDALRDVLKKTPEAKFASKKAYYERKHTEDKKFNIPSDETIRFRILEEEKNRPVAAANAKAKRVALAAAVRAERTRRANAHEQAMKPTELRAFKNDVLTRYELAHPKSSKSLTPAQRTALEANPEYVAAKAQFGEASRRMRQIIRGTPR